MADALAIIAGGGTLPQLLAEHARSQGTPYVVVGFGNADLSWAQDHPLINARFERAGALFKALKQHQCREVVFAGAMIRPKLNPLKFDRKFLSFAPKLLPALKQGDDGTLRVIAELFEAEGIRPIAAHTLLRDLVVTEGVLGTVEPSDTDKIDAKRAAEIATALGREDLGQSVVVAQGICLGLETIQGTDALLHFVSQTDATLRPEPEAGRGLLYKAPKPDQDLRMDLPAIGVDTIDAVVDAGLGGVVIQAEGVMILDRAAVVARADAAGLFLWARART